MDISVHEYDVVIVGAGLAGCTAALEIKNSGLSVCVLTKLHPLRSHSGAAQGGINAEMTNNDNSDSHELDTIKGGDFLGDQKAIRQMCKKAPEIIKWFEDMGAIFSRNEHGKIAQRSLDGQYSPRTCYAKGKTGLTLLQTIYEQCTKIGVEFKDEYYVYDLLYKDGKSNGVFCYDIVDTSPQIFNSKSVLLATGGHGRAYKINSNAHANTGDALSIIARHGLPLEDMEFVQFHPTGLKDTGVLISDIARSEGGYLINNLGERFMKNYAPNKLELAPRDIVSRAIMKEIAEGRGCGEHKDHIMLDLSHIDEKIINSELLEIKSLAMTFLGQDITQEPISIVPTAHYSMGGIPCDINGKVRKNLNEFVDGLYASGECACVSIHGANRLGANSLLESLFFGRQVGKNISNDINEIELVKVNEKDIMNAMNEINKIKASCGNEKVSILRNILQDSMTQNAGVFRSNTSLNRQLIIIKDLRNKFKNIRIDDSSNVYNTDLQEAIEFGHMIDYSHFIVQSALSRKESRGAHFREDYKEKNDQKFQKHTIAYMTDSKDIKIEYMNVDNSLHGTFDRIY